MKKTYYTPNATIVNMEVESIMMAGSTEHGNSGNAPGHNKGNSNSMVHETIWGEDE